MKTIALKLFVFAFLASAVVSIHAEEGDQAENEKTPATSKIEIAGKNEAGEKRGASAAVSEAQSINRGRQLEPESSAAPMNDKDYRDGRLLSE